MFSMWVQPAKLKSVHGEGQLVVYWFVYSLSCENLNIISVCTCCVSDQILQCSTDINIFVHCSVKYEEVFLHFSLLVPGALIP